MDARTRSEKLRAMADQDASPHEAAIAAAKLQEMGAGDQLPPRRPPASSTEPEWGSAEWWMRFGATTSTSTAGPYTHTITFEVG